MTIQPQAPGPRGALPCGPRGLLRTVALSLAAALALLPGSATAQAKGGSTPPVNYLLTEDGTRVPITNPKGFRLFAEEDLAAAGMKMTGGYGWGFPNTGGPCPYYALTVPAFFCGRTQLASGAFTSGYFEIQMVAGTPISEFRKIRAVHPGVSNMTGSFGYTTPYFAELASPKTKRFGPADGQFGNFFSGITTVQDGSCRDNTGNPNGQVPVGFTMLAASDCPPSWAAGGFRGKRPVLDSGWVAAFRANPANFEWNDWQLPRAALDTSQFLGSFSTYGAISDSYREQIARYGSVTKLGSGPSQERGYPLGLDIKFDAWQFARPSIRNAVFWQLTIVNNSARLYGTGIDYDSLYMGFMPGYLINGNQTVTWYHDMQRGTVIGTVGNTSGKCNGTTYPRRVTNTTGCSSTTTTPFANGMQAIMFLKSPLGDLRNKLFSDPASAFYNPTSKNADDTITFNHAKRGGFGGTYNNTFGRSDRTVFGYLSGTEDNFLDGRTLADFTAAQLFTFFSSEDFQGGIGPEAARFNKFVPSGTLGYGKWDHDDDGVPDTISTPTCGRRGCVVNWSDTLPSGLQNLAGNVGNVVDAGPFKLKAGDTTQFLMAFAGTPDSATYENMLNNIISAYLNNFAGANAIAPPLFTAADLTVTPAEVRDSISGVQTAEIRIRLREPDPYQDRFVNDLLGRIQTSTDPRYARLRTLNPTLATSVQSRVSRNFSQLLVFFSCDKGQTFSVSTDCTPARATDVTGTNIGFGWRPISVINVDTLTGKLASNVFTHVVTPGRTYMYSFVTRTRGVIGVPVVDSVGCRPGLTTCSVAAGTALIGPTNLQRALNIDADTISSPLFRSGPSTLTVYAPITLPAGTKLATLDTAMLSGSATQRVTATARSSVQAGNYQVFFANRFVIRTARDTVRGGSEQTITAQRVVRGASTAGGARDTALVVDSVVFKGPGEVVVQGTTAATGTTATSQLQTIPGTRIGRSGDSVIYRDVVTSFNYTTGGVGYLVARNDNGNLRPFFLSTTTLLNPPVEFETGANFPGFVLALETLPTAATPRGIATTSGTSTAGILLRAPGDTLYVSVHQGNGVIYQSTASSRTGPGGLYEIRWLEDAFGPGAPFTFGTKEQLQPILNQSLAARPVGMTAATDTMTARLAGATTARPLVAAKFPFELRGPDGQPVTIAMLQRHTTGAPDSAVKNSILLGTLADTTRVAIPPDLWMPGDSIVIIENVRRDSTVTVGGATTTIVRDTTIGGRTVRAPIQVLSKQVTFPRFVLACTTNTNPSRQTCNPISLGTRGATAYLPFEAGWKTILDFPRPFELFSAVGLTATAQVANGLPASRVGNEVVVVPNPFVIQSQYDVISAARVGVPTIMFTNVPSQGLIRIYSVSGQFLQQLTWTEADLLNRGQGLGGAGLTSNGDLPYNLRTREGLELGSGLYMFVLNETGTCGTSASTQASAGCFKARGKFVIIR